MGPNNLGCIARLLFIAFFCVPCHILYKVYFVTPFFITLYKCIYIIIIVYNAVISIFLFYKISTLIYNFYKMLSSLSTVFIKAHVRCYNFESGRVALRFLPKWSPYYVGYD